MKPVHFRMSSKPPLSRILVSFILVIIVTACNNINTANTSILAQSHPSGTASQPTSTPTSFPQFYDIPSNLKPNPENITIQERSLLIQSLYGVRCPYAQNGQLDQLVFALDQTTYSIAELNQMSAYLYKMKDLKHPLSTTPPPTLRWVLGGSMGEIPGTSGASPCGVDLELTNTGNTPIQIPKVGVNLEARPQQNSYQYHIIDECTFTSCPELGGGGSCDSYDVSIQLGSGEENAVYYSVPNAYNCGIPIIAPAAQVQISVTYNAPNISSNIIYSILPILTVDTVQGEQNLPLLQLVSTIAYASASQFFCYGVPETELVLESSTVTGNCV